MFGTLLLALLLASCLLKPPPVPEPLPAAPVEVAVDARALGPYVGFAPTSVDDARALWFGALVYLPSDARLRADPAARAEVLLTPADFGVGEAPDAVVAYSDARVRIEVPIPQEELSDPQLVVLRHLGQTTGEGAVLAVWTLDGVNAVERPEGTGFNALVALASLPVEDQARIAERLKSDPGSVVIYASRMSVAREVALSAGGVGDQKASTRALNISGPELLGWDFEVKACRLQAPEPWMQALMDANMVQQTETGWTGTFGGKTAVVTQTSTMEELDVALRRAAGI